MKPGDLVMTLRDNVVAFKLDDGDMIGIAERTPALVLEVDVDHPAPFKNAVRVMINGLVGILWSHELEVINETR
jgi:hypothetical protein